MKERWWRFVTAALDWLLDRLERVHDYAVVRHIQVRADRHMLFRLGFDDEGELTWVSKRTDRPVSQRLRDLLNGRQ